MEKKKNENDITTEVVVKDAAIVQPAVSTEEALKQFAAFQDIKEKCLTAQDKEEITGKPYIRKTGWRKIKTVFNLSEEILDSKREDWVDDNGRSQYRWIYRVRVSAKNGAFADAEMSCDSTEDFSWKDKAKTLKKPEAAVMAMAQTRAFNRAISDLVGGGEVTAEEMNDCVEKKSLKQVKAKVVSNDELVCSGCTEKVSQKVYDYSMQNFEKPLCFECQKIVRDNPGGPEDGVDVEDVDGETKNPAS